MKCMSLFVSYIRMSESYGKIRRIGRGHRVSGIHDCFVTVFSAFLIGVFMDKQEITKISKLVCEEITTKREPCDVVMELSQQKAFDVYSKLSEAERRGRLVLGADTIVAIHGRILGKPKDEQDAVSMLQELSGKIHHVYTGVTLLWEDASGQMKRNTFYEDTEVEMYPMSMQEIENYVATGEPMDKAGAYAIQGGCVIYIKEIRGEYSNVVGLPVARLYQELSRMESNEPSDGSE